MEHPDLLLEDVSVTEVNYWGWFNTLSDDEKAAHLKELQEEDDEWDKKYA